MTINVIYFIGGVLRVNAVFGAGVDPIVLDDVRCSGLEERLYDCSNRGPLIHSCGHHEDVGVVCIEGNYGGNYGGIVMFFK